MEKRTAEQFGGKVTLSLTDKLVDGKIVVDQGIIAGRAGGMYDNIAEAAAILDGHDVGAGTSPLSIYPPSVPVNLELIHNGVRSPCWRPAPSSSPALRPPASAPGTCPPTTACPSATPPGTSPTGRVQARGRRLSGVVLMDARSIAATARNHGVLTPATEVSYVQPKQGKRTF